MAPGPGSALGQSGLETRPRVVADWTHENKRIVLLCPASARTPPSLRIMLVYSDRCQKSTQFTSTIHWHTLEALGTWACGICSRGIQTNARRSLRVEMKRTNTRASRAEPPPTGWWTRVYTQRPAGMVGASPPFKFAATYTTHKHSRTTMLSQTQ